MQDANDVITEEIAMNYWNDISERVKGILAAHPTLAEYPNDELFSSWVRNLSPTARGVICNVCELRGAEFCSL
jgi:hypothetical protein